MSISDWIDHYIRGHESGEHLPPLEKERDIARTLAGLERIAFVGVTEFYRQSICALRSLLHSRAMCRCSEIPVTKHDDNRNNASATSLDGPARFKYMQTHIWRRNNLVYAVGFMRLISVLGTNNLTCLLTPQRKALAMV